MIRLVANGDESRWQAVSARVRGGSIRGTPDLDQLPSDSYDAVLLNNPTPRETESIGQSLAQGKHVLIASPVELSPAGLESFTSTAKRAGVQFAVVNFDRYLPSRQLLRQQLDAGKLGRVGLIRMYRWETDQANSSAHQSTLSARLVLDLDLALWIMGLAPHVVFATEARLPQDTGHGRTIQVHLGFPNGPMAMIAYSSALPAGDDYRSLSVVGSSGAAYSDDHQNMQLIYRGDRPQAVRAEEGIRQLVNLTQDFIEAIQTQRDLSPSLTEWSRLNKVTHAVEESLASRRAISLEGS